MPVFWVLHVWKPRHLASMRESSRFSLLVFAPVLIAFLLPAAFLLPVSVVLTSFTLSGLSISLSSAFSYDMWIIGPILEPV